MIFKDEQQIRELHERLITDFMKQLDASINNSKEPITENKSEARSDIGLTPKTKELPASPQEEYGGPDRINEIRKEVAATRPAEILNPDRQSELMEIVRGRCEEFERELRRMPSLNSNIVESAAQQFKDELMDNVRKQLTRDKYVVKD
jgi:hypothetical protein